MSEDHPKKKRKVAVQKFLPSYTSTYPCLCASDTSPSDAFCTICNCSFSVKHGGLYDCRKHLETEKHKSLSKMKLKIKPLTCFLEKDDVEKTTNAEMLFTAFLVEHNLPLSAADHAGHLFRAMFPDSKIAKQYGSGRTKTTAILKCMAKNTASNIVASLKRMPFSMATDGSTDQNAVKLYPVIVRYFDETKQKIVCALLSLKECNENTGQGIFSMLDEEMRKKELSWKNCVAFGCDNASTMLGHLNGVVSHIKKVNPGIYVQGCLCHLLHICAQKATKNLDCDVESLLIDIYFYLDKSSKRKKLLIDCQQIYGLQPYKFLKFVSTRWLSLLEAVSRLLTQWDAIFEFFCSALDHLKENEKFRRIRQVLLSPDTKLYLFFLEATLPLFTTLNVKLQSEAPKIHLVRRYLNSFFTDILVRFLQPSAISEFSSDIININFLKSRHQKVDEDLVIGAKTKAYLANSDISEDTKKKFYRCVRNFYEAACSYAKKKLPFSSDILKHAEVADPALRQVVSFSSVIYFVNLFFFNDNLDVLEIEFCKYQIDPLNEEILSSNADVAWYKISNLKDDENGSTKYCILPKVMLAILLIPQSNAACERIFSLVRNNLTDFRSSMNIETLNALLTEKINLLNDNTACYKKEFSKNEIVNAKKATMQDLKQLKSSSVGFEK